MLQCVVQIVGSADGDPEAVTLGEVSQLQRLNLFSEKELLKEFNETGSHEKTNPQSEGFFRRVKELWEDLKD